MEGGEEAWLVRAGVLVDTYEFEEEREEPQRSKACQGIVEWGRPDKPSVERDGDRHPSGKVRLFAHHESSFAMAVEHHSELFHELLDRLHGRGDQSKVKAEEGDKSFHQVSASSPQQLRRSRRGGGCEVFFLDAEDREPSFRSIKSGNGSSRSSANDEDVKFFSFLGSLYHVWSGGYRSCFGQTAAAGNSLAEQRGLRSMESMLLAAESLAKLHGACSDLRFKGGTLVLACFLPCFLLLPSPRFSQSHARLMLQLLLSLLRLLALLFLPFFLVCFACEVL